MKTRRPRYVLVADTAASDHGPRLWRFALHGVGRGEESLAVEDHEPGADAQRLELLAAVRGLEALDQPSELTLITGSRYVSRGIRRGLAQWRSNQWRWERFGRLTPIRDCDLWRRVDRALAYHRVDCRTWRVEPIRTAADFAEAVCRAPRPRCESVDTIPVGESPADIGRFDAPAIMIVRPERSRRRGRFSLREERKATPRTSAAAG